VRRARCAFVCQGLPRRTALIVVPLPPSVTLGEAKGLHLGRGRRRASVDHRQQEITMADQLIRRRENTWCVRVCVGPDAPGKRSYINQTVHGTTGRLHVSRSSRWTSTSTSRSRRSCRPASRSFTRITRTLIGVTLGSVKPPEVRPHVEPERLVVAMQRSLAHARPPPNGPFSSQEFLSDSVRCSPSNLRR
jgi:hypothetical protein